MKQKNKKPKSCNSAQQRLTPEVFENCYATPEPIVDLAEIGDTERSILEDIVDAFYGINIDNLPEDPRGDTIRGLFWALEAVLSPLTEPHKQHLVPFNANLTQEEAALGRAAIEKVWEISSSLLVGLRFLCAHGYVIGRGVELPACWSPGDFDGAIESARDSLARLTELNDKLYRLRYGEPVPRQQVTDVPQG
jgi:hypothetical protein